MTGAADTDNAPPGVLPQGLRDQVFAKRQAAVGDFRFDEQVAQVFSDMIQRSVPGYGTIVSMMSVFADHFVQANTCVYDLGSSLGACSFAVLDGIGDREANIVAVDNSPAMVERLNQQIEARQQQTPSVAQISTVLSDLCNVPMNNASMVILNFTLQFVPLAMRDGLIQSIYNGLNPGGALVISEKLAFTDEHFDASMIHFHHDFKRANGYSDLEISQKREALDNVLLPESREAHIRRLKLAGFAQADVWFQCFNFASLIAIKS